MLFCRLSTCYQLWCLWVVNYLLLMHRWNHSMVDNNFHVWDEFCQHVKSWTSWGNKSVKVLNFSLLGEKLVCNLALFVFSYCFDFAFCRCFFCLTRRVPLWPCDSSMYSFCWFNSFTIYLSAIFVWVLHVWRWQPDSTQQWSIVFLIRKLLPYWSDLLICSSLNWSEGSKYFFSFSVIALFHVTYFTYLLRGASFT